jgi:hypothetical protein
VFESNGCLYDAGCVTGAGSPYWLNDECYAWVIDVDEYCCENEWDEICQATYDYCEGTWVGPTPTRLANNIINTYPNPTGGNLYINKKVDVEVINYVGNVIISKNNVNVLDLTRLTSGVYMLRITYDNKTINKTIIKN